MPLCAVSVDLDEIPNYHAIHGLPPPSGASATAVYDLALPRLERLARDVGMPLTLFAIGRDLARPESAAALARAASVGHELANHSLNHLYDLSRRGRAEVLRQVDDGARALEEATGVRPRGFRAPGYTVDDELFSVLEEAGVAYDASVFPCPAYHGAKVAALASMALRGRASRSIVGDPRVLAAPVRPYRVGVPYWRRGGGMVEIPVQVTPRARLPFIGTALTLAGERGARLLARAVAGEPCVNLELHGIDLLDERDGLEALAPHQPDVRIPHDEKRRRICAALEVLRARGHRFVTMGELAATVA